MKTLDACKLGNRVTSTLTELSRTDLRHAEAALGFFEFGLHDEAWQEIEEIRPAARADVAVLILRVEILLATGQTKKARLVAAAAVRTHPDAGLTHYALALVQARVGDFLATRDSLAAAFLVAPELKVPALEDERLEAFWRNRGA